VPVAPPPKHQNWTKVQCASGDRHGRPLSYFERRAASTWVDEPRWRTLRAKHQVLVTNCYARSVVHNALFTAIACVSGVISSRYSFRLDE
jgi:hypothetical protein